ncbi:unnamed protein product, partial [Rotaria sp. Silwood2]
THYADYYRSMGNKNTSAHLTKTLSINEHEKNRFIQQHNLKNNEDIDSCLDNSSYKSYNGKKHGPSPRFRRHHTKQIHLDKKGKKNQVNLLS